MWIPTRMSVSFAGCGATSASAGGRSTRLSSSTWNTVRPMHQQFVEPGRRHADIVIPEGGKNDAAMELLVHWLATKVRMSEKSLS